MFILLKEFMVIFVFLSALRDIHNYLYIGTIGNLRGTLTIES